MTPSLIEDRLTREERHARPFHHYRAPIYIKDGKKYFYRLTLNQRIQHVALFLSVFVLIFTGIPLRFPEAPLFARLYDFLGGISILPAIHRVAGTVMCLLFFYHLVYLIHLGYRSALRPLRQSGKLTFRSGLAAILSLPIMPGVRDFKDFVQNLKYLLRLSDRKPAYPRYGWKEKLDYFALYWSIPLMGISGLLLWQRDLLSRVLPGVVFNVALIAHSYEALLAVSFLIAWHFYNVHLHLHKFPMAKSFITGYVTEEQMIEEHYEEYVRVMTQQGLGQEIRAQHPETIPVRPDSFRSRLVKLLSALITVSLIAGIYYAMLKLTLFSRQGLFPSQQSAVSAPSRASESPLEELQFDSLDGKKQYRGHRILGSDSAAGRFHRLGLELAPDNRSFCIQCHGDLCHQQLPRLRTFLNMHSQFLACEVCHSPPPAAEQDRFGVFKWYATDDGAIADTPKGGLPLSARLGYKVIPFIRTDSAWERLDADELLELTATYIRTDATLTPEERERSIHATHRYVAKQAVQCRDCHTQETPYLPLASLGYSESRTRELKGPAVVGLIQDNREFFLPSILDSEDKGE